MHEVDLYTSKYCTVCKVQNRAVKDHSDFRKYSVTVTRISLFL